MKLFPHGHATHPQWRMAAGLVLAQLRAHMALPGYASEPTLGLVYITDHYEAEAAAILDFLASELPQVTDWSGTVGVGIAANQVEYFDEPALSVMLCDVPPHLYRVFSGVSPLGVGFEPACALVHVDASTPDLAELVEEMAQRTSSGYLFGGLTSSRSEGVQFAVAGNGNLRGHGAANGVFRGGLSGVAFAEGVALLSRVTQGCQPLRSAGNGAAAMRRVTACDRNLILQLDGQPALALLMADLGVSLEQLREALAAVRQTLVGVVQEGGDERGLQRTGSFGSDVLVRHIIGLDPAREGVAVAREMAVGDQVAFCQRHMDAARADLMRICAEIREELEPAEMALETAQALAVSELATPHPARRIAGAVYVSCAGRGGPHFGAPSAELQIVRRALGDVPLVGFFASGEVARHHVYGYTGVLTVFVAPGV